MLCKTCEIPGVLLLEPRVFTDSRGFFLECFQENRYREVGIPDRFVQGNCSRSVRGTLRGLHYQISHPQGKLVWVVRGEVLDVVVDLRRSSPMFGRWWSVVLSDTNHHQLWVPPGLAHGFCVLSELADMFYQCTDFWYAQHERTIRWDDPDLKIAWPSDCPLISDKDARGLAFAEAPYFEAATPGSDRQP